jgi:molybdopterin converting factor small subunit
MRSLSVLLFARYAELLGAPRIEVPAESAADVGAIVAYLRGLPGGEGLPERPFVAVNMERANLDYRPGPGDEIALLPPMAGG